MKFKNLPHYPAAVDGVISKKFARKRFKIESMSFVLEKTGQYDYTKSQVLLIQVNLRENVLIS